MFVVLGGFSGGGGDGCGGGGGGGANLFRPGEGKFALRG